VAKLITIVNLIILLLTPSCTEQGGVIPDGVEFKKTMRLSVNGHKGVGTLVVPSSNRYKIKIDIDSRAELLKLSSCHREISVQRGGWFSKRTHTFKFNSAIGIENEGFCPIMIGSFDKKCGHQWGMIEIRNKKLPSTLHCNGGGSRL